MKLETKRLRIYPADQKRMEDMIAKERDPEMKKAYGEMLAGCLKQPEQWDWYAVWVIELKNETPIGDLCFKGLSPAGTAEIGYGILDAYQGQGCATEAVKAALGWAFGHPEVNRIEAETEPGNGASQRVLTKCGFLPNGQTGEEGPRFSLPRESFSAMDGLRLIRASEEKARDIEAFVKEFPAEGICATWQSHRIPGLDHLEEYKSVGDWLSYVQAQKGKTDFFLTVDKDGRVVGTCCLRRKLAYDDDEMAFASHIGYAVRPSEQGKGIGTKQLRLALGEAKKIGLQKARLVCVDSNVKSNKVICACGGLLVDSIYGEESGLTVNRYDIELK